MGNSQTLPQGNVEGGQHIHLISDSAIRRKLRAGVLYNMRIVIRGVRGTGKTALWQRLQGLPFVPQYTETAEVQTSTINWSFRATEEAVKVEVWDVVDKGLSNADQYHLEGGRGIDNQLASLPSAQTSTGGRRHQAGVLDASLLDVYKGTHAAIFMLNPSDDSTVAYVKKALPEVPPGISIAVLVNFKDLAITDGVGDGVYREMQELVREQSAREKQQGIERELICFECSTKDCYGLKVLYDFFNIPFLALKRESLLLQLNQTDLQQKSAQHDLAEVISGIDYAEYCRKLKQPRGRAASPDRRASNMFSTNNASPSLGNVGEASAERAAIGTCAAASSSASVNVGASPQRSGHTGTSTTEVHRERLSSKESNKEKDRDQNSKRRRRKHRHKEVIGEGRDGEADSNKLKEKSKSKRWKEKERVKDTDRSQETTKGSKSSRRKSGSSSRNLNTGEASAGADHALGAGSSATTSKKRRRRPLAGAGAGAGATAEAEAEAEVGHGEGRKCEEEASSNNKEGNQDHVANKSQPDSPKHEGSAADGAKSSHIEAEAEAEAKAEGGPQAENSQVADQGQPATSAGQSKVEPAKDDLDGFLGEISSAGESGAEESDSSSIDSEDMPTFTRLKRVTQAPQARPVQKQKPDSEPQPQPQPHTESEKESKIGEAANGAAAVKTEVKRPDMAPEVVQVEVEDAGEDAEQYVVHVTEAEGEEVEVEVEAVEEEKEVEGEVQEELQEGGKSVDEHNSDVDERDEDGSRGSAAGPSDSVESDGDEEKEQVREFGGEESEVAPEAEGIAGSVSQSTATGATEVVGDNGSGSGDEATDVPEEVAASGVASSSSRATGGKVEEMPEAERRASTVEVEEEHIRPAEQEQVEEAPEVEACKDEEEEPELQREYDASTAVPESSSSHVMFNRGTAPREAEVGQGGRSTGSERVDSDGLLDSFEPEAGTQGVDGFFDDDGSSCSDEAAPDSDHSPKAKAKNLAPDEEHEANPERSKPHTEAVLDAGASDEAQTTSQAEASATPSALKTISTSDPSGLSAAARAAITAALAVAQDEECNVSKSRSSKGRQRRSDNSGEDRKERRRRKEARRKG
ncbi:unnamed protein product [Chrysoparadoxa australica]